MKNFEVKIERATTQLATILVEAETAMEALELAKQRAETDDLGLSECDWDYVDIDQPWVTGIEES